MSSCDQPRLLDQYSFILDEYVPGKGQARCSKGDVYSFWPRHSGELSQSDKDSVGFQNMLAWKAYSRRFSRAASAGLVGGHIFHRSEICDSASGSAYPGMSAFQNEIDAIESRTVGNRPCRNYIEILPGGIAFKREQPKGNNKPLGGGSRSDVVGFSKNSRKRLMDVLMRFDFDAHTAKGKRSPAARSMFCTLTFSDSAPFLQEATPESFDWQRLKRDLDTFGKRLKRLKNFQGMLWKVEIEPRKSGALKGNYVPHFHCLILFKQIQRVHTFRRWLSQAWFSVVGSGDSNHLKAGTNALVAYGGATGKLFSYLGKYLGKTFEVEGIKAGRIWGIIAGIDQENINPKTGKPEAYKNPLSLVDGKAFFTDKSNVWEVFIESVRAWGSQSHYIANLSYYQSAGVIFCGKDELKYLEFPAGGFTAWEFPDLSLIGG